MASRGVGRGWPEVKARLIMRRRCRPLRGSLLALAVLVTLVAPALPAQAQIGMPVDLGFNQADGSAVDMLSMSTSTMVPVGASIIVVAVSQRAGSNGSPDVATCSDGAGNPY